MRIVCPNCDTAYNVPESVVAAGRAMRCAKCRIEWSPGRPMAEAAPGDATPPVPAHFESTESETEASPPLATRLAEPELALPPAFTPPAVPFPLAAEPPPAEPELVIHAPFPDAPPAHPPPRKAVMAAWGASLLVLIVAFWLAIAFRQSIVRQWPPAARILGTPVSR